MFGEKSALVKPYLQAGKQGVYHPRSGLQKQAEVATYFSGAAEGSDEEFVRQALLNLISNVILFEVAGSEGNYFHFRISMEETTSFQWLDEETKAKLRDLYVNYFLN